MEDDLQFNEVRVYTVLSKSQIIEKFDLLQSEVEELEHANPNQLLTIGVVSIGLAFLAEKAEKYSKVQEPRPGLGRDASVFFR